MRPTGRFAPSPTGPLHAGSMVAALASWLDARAHGGRWLVRIEDVDLPRCIPGADEFILLQLARCGLIADEPVVWQSQRHDLDLSAMRRQLMRQQRSFACSCSRRDIEQAWLARGQVRREPLAGWSTLLPSQVPRLGQLAAGWAALGMASLHPEGRVRAEAVGVLQGRVEGDRAELAFLLLRLNDWVEPVRTIARAAIEARLGVGHVEAWVHASPLVEALARRSRVDHRSTIDAVTELLRAPAARRALRRGTTALDLSWQSLRFIIDIGVADGALVGRGLLDGDPRVRRAVAGQLQRMPDDDDWCELLILAIRHREGEVHRLGLAALLAQPAARQRRVFKRLLLDRRARSRSVARDGMRRIDPGFDAPAWYRDALAVTRDPVELAAAIQGYGECEEAVDIAVLAPFYRHAKNRVKAAASIATTRITRRVG